MFLLVSLSKSKIFHSCRTRVVRVALGLHLCRIRVARVPVVSNSCHQCRIRVARVWHSCCKLDQIEQNRTRVFSNNELFIFHCNNSTSFESVFCIKTVKSRLFKKYLKRRKSQARFCLSLSWLNISEKKIIDHYNSVSAGTHKVGKAVSL